MQEELSLPLDTRLTHSSMCRNSKTSGTIRLTPSQDVVEDIVGFAGEEGHCYDVMEMNAFHQHPHKLHGFCVFQQRVYRLTKRRLKVTKSNQNN